MERLYLGITVTSTYTLVAMALISSVHAIRPPQLPAVSSLSSGGMSVAHIKANRMTPATSTMEGPLTTSRDPSGVRNCDGH